MRKICQQCEQTFEVFPSEAGRRFCSHACYAQSMVARITKTCGACGARFEVKASQTKIQYCSKACMNQARTHRITKNCEICGNSFDVQQSQKNKRFCSTKCAGQGRLQQIERVCEGCSKPFSVYQSRANRNPQYCSWACYTAKAELTCEYCGLTFYVKRGHAHKRKTCSKRCNEMLKGQEGRSARMGQAKSEDEIQKISKAMHEYHQANPTKHPWYVDGSHANGAKRRGPSWDTQRKLARERDNHTCQKCGKTREQLGKNLSVHHKKPYRYFASDVEANALDNLISLCQSCHMRWEHSEDNPPFS